MKHAVIGYFGPAHTDEEDVSLVILVETNEPMPKRTTMQRAFSKMASELSATVVCKRLSVLQTASLLDQPQEPDDG